MLLAWIIWARGCSSSTASVRARKFVPRPMDGAPWTASGRFRRSSLRVDRPEQLVAQRLAHAHVRAVGREHGADHAEFGYATPQLLDGLVHVLQRQQRYSLEPRAPAGVAVVEPVVVGAAERHCPVGVLDHADRQTGGRIEDGRLDTCLVHETEPFLGADVARVTAGDGPEEVALVAVQRGEEREVGPVLEPAPYGLVKVLPNLVVVFLDVPVAVDDQVLVVRHLLNSSLLNALLYQSLLIVRGVS